MVIKKSSKEILAEDGDKMHLLTGKIICLADEANKWDESIKFICESGKRVKDYEQYLESLMDIIDNNLLEE